MKQFFIGLMVTLAAFSAKAFDPVVAASSIPTNNPQWSSNAIYPKVSSKFNVSSNGVAIQTGQMATNSIPRISTNSTALWKNPVYLGYFDNMGLNITGNASSNSSVSLYIFLYPTTDMVTFDSNNPIVLGPITNTLGTSNFTFNTNISSTMGPSTMQGYFLGGGVTGSNTVTNLFVQPIAKEKIVLIGPT